LREAANCVGTASELDGEVSPATSVDFSKLTSAFSARIGEIRSSDIRQLRLHSPAG